MKKLIFNKLSKDINIFFIFITLSISTIIWIIQAVNFLDLVSEDGHSLKIYFLFTSFSYPKIISKVLPFMFMISLFYTILKYEINNELIIYWVTGISKINFINIIIKISLFYFLLQIILTVLIVPYSSDKARSFFRTSNTDLYTSIIKEKKFIDTVKNFTIFVEKKNNNELKNVLIKEKLNNQNTQIIISQSGILVNNDLEKRLILKEGKIFKTENQSQNIINFSEFNLDLTKYATNTIVNRKTQEMNSSVLYKCIKIIKNKNNFTYDKKDFFPGCNYKISNAIIEEFAKRFISPLFIILIGLVSSLLILNSRDKKKYKIFNISIFLFGVITIIISEIGLGFSSLSYGNLKYYFLIPTIIFIVTYFIVLFIHLKKR